MRKRLSTTQHNTTQKKKSNQLVKKKKKTTKTKVNLLHIFLQVKHQIEPFIIGEFYTSHSSDDLCSSERGLADRTEKRIVDLVRMILQRKRINKNEKREVGIR
jgi:hypothetical protein